MMNNQHRGLSVWLDDLRPMPKEFDVHCTLVEEVIALLEADKVGFISFDNDLGTGNLEGYDLAKYVEEHAFRGLLRRISWSIHSGNSVGRNNITKALTNADSYWTNHEQAG